MTKPRTTTPPAAGGGGTCGPTHTQSCCPADFRLSPCHIVKAGGTLQIAATELPGFAAGTYVWSTTSPKITLTNPNSATVTVNGLANPSASRDAEVITVTRTAPGCPPVVKTVNVTVAKVTFSAAANQRYGYDDFDTPANTLDDHICIKRSDYTFLHVVIEGGALGTDFDFVCDNPAICTPVAPAAVATFDLRLNSGPQVTDHTTLHARVKCPGAESFTHIEVHVYKEKEVDVVVAKIYDSTVAGTNLNYPNADYASHAPDANAKLKEAVVKYNIFNYDAANGRTDVRYDLDNNGALSYDIANNGGVELTAITSAMTGTGTRTRVAIVRTMKSYYYLSAAAAINDRTITVTAGSVFAYPARLVPLDVGAAMENVTVLSSAGNTITLSAPLTKAHAAGAPLEFPAGGWSADPILIIEGTTALSVVKWTILHEVGHRNPGGLNLLDVDDATDFMHWMQSWTDYRLRYCPRTKKHEPGTENQWETIPR